MGEVVDYLDTHSIGALATTLGHRVKDVCTIRCRSCGADFVMQAGAPQEAEILEAEAERLPLPDVHPPLSAVVAGAAGGRQRRRGTARRPARAGAGLEGCPLHDEDDGEDHVAPFEVDGLVLGIRQPEVERSEG